MDLHLPTYPPGFSSYSDLAPVLSKDQVYVHYNDHHRKYIEKLQELLPLLPFDPPSLGWLLTHLDSIEDPELEALVRTNGGQFYNHVLYWQGLSGPTSLEHSEFEPLDSMLRETFGSLESFFEQVPECASQVVGSGWCWLTLTGEDNLELQTTQNADSPLTLGTGIPVWCLDVWEHAYYVDYLADRNSYSRELINQLFNWPVVNSLLQNRL